MMSVAITNKIKKLRFVRMHGGLKRASPGIGDWAGRQPGKSIGVIRRIHSQVLMMEASAVCARQLFRVNDAGVRIKRHTMSESVVIDARDARPFLRRCCLFLND